MNTDLVIITSGYRRYNLLSIAKNIVKNYEKYRDRINLYWIIANDQYNGKGNMDKFFKYMKDIKLSWLLEDSAIYKGTPNYGGDIYNHALQFGVKEWFKINGDPWIYILDDDNLLHDKFFDGFLNALKVNDQRDDKYKIIFCNMKLEDGLTKQWFRYSASDYNAISGWQGWHNIVDPSGVIMKYSIYEKYKFIPGEFLYDQKWLTSQIVRNELEEDTILFTQDYLNNFNISTTYHNAIYTKENIEKYLASNNEDIHIDVNIYEFNSNEKVPTINFPILTNEAKKKIMDIIYIDITTNKLNELNNEEQY